MTHKSFYAIRLNNPIAYMGKPSSGDYCLKWYKFPVDARLYELQKSAERLAKYYRSLGIECQAVKIVENPNASVNDCYKDMSLELSDR